jgi:hypothetical protein
MACQRLLILAALRLLTHLLENACALAAIVAFHFSAGVNWWRDLYEFWRYGSKTAVALLGDWLAVTACGCVACIIVHRSIAAQSVQEHVGHGQHLTWIMQLD